MASQTLGWHQGLAVGGGAARRGDVPSQQQQQPQQQHQQQQQQLQLGRQEFVPTEGQAQTIRRLQELQVALAEASSAA